MCHGTAETCRLPSIMFNATQFNKTALSVNSQRSKDKQHILSHYFASIQSNNNILYNVEILCINMSMLSIMAVGIECSSMDQPTTQTDSKLVV